MGGQATFSDRLSLNGLPSGHKSSQAIAFPCQPSSQRLGAWHLHQTINLRLTLTLLNAKKLIWGVRKDFNIGAVVFRAVDIIQNGERIGPARESHREVGAAGES
jgi:hypothetical protein